MEQQNIGRAVLVVTTVVVLLAAAIVGGLWATGIASFSSAKDLSAQHPPVTITVPPPSSPAPQDPTTPTSPPITSSPPKTLAQVYAEVESGVGLVEVTTCDGAVSGSGFLVDETTFVTAEHVVDGAVTVDVKFAGRVQPASVIGIDAANDLALLSLANQPGHVFDLASTDPGPGTSIAAIGFPLGGPKSLTQGTISGLRRTITTERGTFRGLLQTDTAINPGNSGGPLIDANGDVVGVADAILTGAQGIGYAVSASKVSEMLSNRESLEQPPRPGCVQDPSAETAVTQTLQSYLLAINVDDYAGAMRLLAPKFRISRAQWEHDYSTTIDTRLRVRDIDVTGFTAHAWATFVSHQAAGSGPDGAPEATCTAWSLDYVLTRVEGGRWIISDAKGHTTPAYRVC